MDKEGEPGTAKFGNFINYYSFNPASRRIDLIPETLLHQILNETSSNVLCLDVGCNSGELTEALYAYLRSVSCGNKATDKEAQQAINPNLGNIKEKQNVYMLGIDIDPLLIERCRRHTLHPDHITYKTANVMNPTHREELEEFLSQHSATVFTITVCFSVTLWIHLHHGDEGLQDFLKYICKNTKHLLIEPQPYKCYKTAVRRMKRANCDGFPHFESLKWRQNVDQEIVDFIVENCSMTLIKVLGETTWERKVCYLRAYDR